jgi:hypothetical protein
MAPENSAAPRKKKPAIGSTVPIARKEKTRPSMMWSAEVCMALGPSAAKVATSMSRAAVPPTSAAASPPFSSVRPGMTLGASMKRISAPKTIGVRIAIRLVHGEAGGTAAADRLVAAAPSAA